MLSGNGELDSRKVADVSSQAEGKGFDGLWVGETTLRDASVLASVAACANQENSAGHVDSQRVHKSTGPISYDGSNHQ